MSKGTFPQIRQVVIIWQMFIKYLLFTPFQKLNVFLGT